MIVAEISSFAVLGVVLVFGVILLAKAKEFFEYLAERKRRREFKDFENVISGANSDPEAARKYFSGEVKLSDQVNVIIPILLDADERMRLQDPIDAMLRDAEIGYVVRGYELADTCGFDLLVNDFVSGVDLIRRQLIQGSAPRGTLIEYSGGDLAIYEDD